MRGNNLTGGESVWAAILRRPLVLALFAIALLAAGIHSGWLLSELRLPARAEAKYRRMTGEKIEDEISYTQKRTGFHKLEIARLPVQRAYQLADVGGNIVMSTRFGELNYMVGSKVHSLHLSAPLGLSGLWTDGLAQNENFTIRNVRVTDLLSIARDPTHYDLYVAHMVYEKPCFRMAVSTTPLVTRPGYVEAETRQWKRVYATSVCVQLRKAKALFRGSEESGGRIQLIRPGVLAMTIGSMGHHDELTTKYADTELSKLIEIHLDGSPPSVIARGMRNPQGLLFANGRLWETEHGPQGGDELNLMEPGKDYGWPHVSYGLSYAAKLTPWNQNPDFSGHEGYTKPIFSWVPSIGASNLIAPDTREFEHWNHHLLVASLRGATLHLLRLEDKTVIYDEPIQIGQRIRDIISLSDGRIALASDTGDLFIIRNDEHKRADHDLEVAGVEALPPPLREAALIESPVRRGGELFAARCSQCHSLEGLIGTGPPLNGKIGMQVASSPGYPYSPALRKQHFRWTKERLAEFIQAPSKVYPGTFMDPPILANKFEAQRIAEYLAQRREDGSTAAEPTPWWRLGPWHQAVAHVPPKAASALPPGAHPPGAATSAQPAPH